MNTAPPRGRSILRKIAVRLVPIVLIAACFGGGEFDTPEGDLDGDTHGATPLFSQVRLDISGEGDLYYVNVPSGAVHVEIRTGGGTGDLDLYGKWNNVPTPSSYNYGSTGSDTDTLRNHEFIHADTHSVGLPARLFVLVSAVAPYSGAYIEVRITCDDPQATVLSGAGATCPNTTVTNPGGGVDTGALQCGRYEVLEAGSTIECGYSCDGSGRIRDTKTGYTWTARPATVFAVGNTTFTTVAKACTDLGMRLPTLAEYKAVFGPSSYCASAFPKPAYVAFTNTKGAHASGDGLYDYLCYVKDTDEASGCINRVAAHCLK